MLFSWLFDRVLNMPLSNTKNKKKLESRDVFGKKEHRNIRNTAFIAAKIWQL